MVSKELKEGELDHPHHHHQSSHRSAWIHEHEIADPVIPGGAFVRPDADVDQNQIIDDDQELDPFIDSNASLAEFLAKVDLASAGSPGFFSTTPAAASNYKPPPPFKLSN